MYTACLFAPPSRKAANWSIFGVGTMLDSCLKASLSLLQSQSQSQRCHLLRPPPVSLSLSLHALHVARCFRLVAQQAIPALVVSALQARSALPVAAATRAAAKMMFASRPKIVASRVSALGRARLSEGLQVPGPTLLQPLPPRQ